jgi:glycosyltransferase involved in cell wall biosynthesis
MKNILYIAPYRQKDGWGQAAYNYLQSIIYASQKLGYNLKIAPVYFTGQVWESLKTKPTDDFSHLTDLENANINQFDTIIQKGLPESLWYNQGTNNIAITVLETQNLQHTRNKHILNKFNHLLVPSSIEKQTLQKAGVITHIENILEPINTIEIDNYIQKNHIIPKNKYSSYVKFYFIGEFVPRKNIIDLMIAFSLAFKSTDKVVLFIKTSSSVNIEKMNLVLKERFESLKHGMLNHNIIFLNRRLPRDELLNLHNVSDIFICPSKGEAFCIPLAEAMRFGNIPIAVENTSPTSFVNENNGYIIPAKQEICLGDDGSATLDTYSSNETWMHPTIYDIIQILKQSREDLLNNQELMLIKKQKARESTEAFTYQSIGEKICSLEIM